MRKYFFTASCACLLYLSLSPALALSNEANFIREYRSKAVQAQFNNRYDEAVGHYQRALDLASQTYGANSPFLAEIYYDMGALAFTNSQFNNAEEWLNMAVKLNPNSSGGRLKLAELESLRGHTEEAVKQASLVVAKHRDDPVAHQQLAIALDKDGDSLRSLREFSVAEQLSRMEKLRADGRAAAAKPIISIPPLWQSPKPTASAPVPNVDSKPPDPKAAEKQKKAAEAAAKKAADEAKKLKTEMAKAEAAQKDAAKKADAAAKKADQKKAQDAKRAADAAKLAKAKAAQTAAKAAAKKAPEPVAADTSLTGLKANLTSKAVLLTKVGKKPAAAQSTTTTELPKPVIKPLTKAEPKFDESVADEPDEVAKPAAKKVVKPAEAPKVQPQVIKPIKPMKGGLVPPPPPVIPTMQMMPPPQAMVAPAAKPKAAAPKKEAPKVETPKEEKPAATHHDSGAGGADDDDFLLDWGGAKGKKK